jgi:KaiC/GvpD/RAD55 family RecA-like ATPase
MLLSIRTQASIIVDLLQGRQVELDPADLTGEWAGYYQWILTRQDESPEQRWHSFMLEFAERSETHFANTRLLRELWAYPIEYESADQVLERLPDLHWLWHPWIPRGLVTVCFGDAGTGKTYLLLDIAQRVALGTAYPDATPVQRPGCVLFVDAENKPAVFKRRVSHWGDELARMFYMMPAMNRLMINLDHDLDRERFLDRVYRIRPELIVIDSYGSITLRGENAKEDAQKTLIFLTAVAKDYDCAAVVIHHPRKPTGAMQSSLSGGEMSIHNVRGSGYIVQMATNVLGLQLTGLDRNGPRKLHVVKNNLGQYPDPIGVTYTPWENDPEVAVLSYGQVLQAEKPKKIEQCADWLIELLREQGALSTNEIMVMGEEVGFNRRMIYRARKRAGADIVDTESPYWAGNGWALRDYTKDGVDDQ